jgi:hypothetical protein
MRMLAALTAVGCLLGFAGSSHASHILASPAVYGSVNQKVAQCVLGNFGIRDVPVTSFQIVDEAGNPFSVEGTCGAVPAGDICSIATFAGSIPTSAAVACQASLSNGETIRGSLTIFDGNRVALRTTELR